MRLFEPRVTALEVISGPRPTAETQAPTPNHLLLASVDIMARFLSVDGPTAAGGEAQLGPRMLFLTHRRSVPYLLSIR